MPQPDIGPYLAFILLILWVVNKVSTWKTSLPFQKSTKCSIANGEKKKKLSRLEHTIP